MTIYVKKSAIYTTTDKTSEKHMLYNYIVNILLDRVMTQKIIPNDKKIEFIASRRETNKVLNDNFISYIKDESKKHPFELEIKIKMPAQEKWLQVVDFISRAIYQKYEKNNNLFYNIIKNKIIEEKSLF